MNIYLSVTIAFVEKVMGSYRVIIRMWPQKKTTKKTKKKKKKKNNTKSAH